MVFKMSILIFFRISILIVLIYLLFSLRAYMENSF